MSSVSFNPFASPGAIDQTQSRETIHGNVAFTGTYVTGGLTPNWNNLTDVSGQTVLISKDTSTAPFLVSNISITSNVVTVFANTTLKAGQSVGFSALTANGAVLNGNLYPAESITTQSFTVSQIAGNTTGNVAQNGFAFLIVGPDSFEAESIAGSGLTYGYNKANANIQIFTGNLELASGTALGTDTIQGTASYVRN